MIYILEWVYDNVKKNIQVVKNCFFIIITHFNNRVYIFFCTSPGLITIEKVINHLLQPLEITIRNIVFINISKLKLSEINIKNNTAYIQLNDVHINYSLWKCITNKKINIEKFEVREAHIKINTKSSFHENKINFNIPYRFYVKEINIFNKNYLKNKNSIFIEKINGTNISITKNEYRFCEIYATIPTYNANIKINNGNIAFNSTFPINLNITGNGNISYSDKMYHYHFL